ncbi:MAG: winged helix-turn-helix domain-containing protein [bacterium]
METISLKTVRKFVLDAQGLLRNEYFGSGKNGALKCIEHLGYVQIDTISVVQRAHHHVLWSRVRNYKPVLLDILQREKRVFEYWSHAAAYLPMADFRYYLPMMHALRNGEIHWWFRKEKKPTEFVLDRIKAEGALSARDFDDPEKKRGDWWQWKPAKKALEQLFMEGYLMIEKRVNFQKVYDLTERVLPAHIDTTMPSKLEMAKFLILAALRAHGLMAEPEIAYLRGNPRPHVRTGLAELLEAGKIAIVGIKELPGTKYYALSEALPGLARLRQRNKITILSPFDNAIIQRKRTQKLFGFDYQLECYLPKPKRKFGYFCLPILRGDTFIGRVDAKADRPNHLLIVRNLVFEQDTKILENTLPELAKALRAFAAFNECEKIRLEKGQPKKLMEGLLRSL